MLGLSPSGFKKKLIKRAEQRGNHIIEIDESYTSKTCGRCGEIQKIEGREYKCEKCGLKINRDINVARYPYFW